MTLPPDLLAVVESLNERLNVCRMLSLADLKGELPSRALSPEEAEALVRALADAGIHLPDPDAARRLSGP